MVDDNVFVREAWRIRGEGLTVHAFASPGELWATLEAAPDLLKRLKCVVTDFHFGADQAETGDAVARRIAAMNGPPVLLSSDTDGADTAADAGTAMPTDNARGESRPNYAAIIPKRPLARQALVALLTN